MNTVSFRQAMLERGIDLGAVRADLGNLSTPGAAEFRPDNWDEPTSNYKVAPGDTLAALAALYLDNAGRAMEIWNYQNDERKVGGSPDQIYAGEWIDMPPEALANAKILGAGGTGTSGQGTGLTPPGTEPGKTSTKTKAVVGIGIGLAALLALYFATR